MSNIAIIPARSGSKGLPDKNIKLLAGVPLIAYTIYAALQSNIFEEVYVSTDSQTYAEIAQKWGAKVPFLREPELSTDTASSWDVVRSALSNYRKMGMTFETVTLLQPTSPLRTSQDILESFKMYNRLNANAIVSVCEMEHSPLWSNTLPDDYSLINFFDVSNISKPRQLLPKYYRINGALYIVNVNSLFIDTSIYTDKSYAYIMDKNRSIDIDDEYDFIYAELMLNREKEIYKGLMNNSET